MTQAKTDCNTFFVMVAIFCRPKAIEGVADRSKAWPIDRRRGRSIEGVADRSIEPKLAQVWWR
jgi:hypothetical protein